jgi:CheY-like chemotaxis protein
MEENPILIIDDDQDDLELIKQAAEHLRLSRPIYYFKNGDQLQDFLQTSPLSPFLIICDVNLPGRMVLL